MLGLKKVAVTGGVSCGKSTVCRFFKELGAYVVSADKVVHQLLSPDISLGQKVIELIGPDVVVNQQIDRSIIAKRVFNHPELLKSLEAILHPAVREELERQYQLVKDKNEFPLFIAEIPLLFETGADKFYDITIAVTANVDLCQQRFEIITGHDKVEFDRRMKRQIHPNEKAQKADYVIQNNSSLSDLQRAVKLLFNELTREKITL